MPEHRHRSHNIWNFVFSAFFVVVLAAAGWYMKEARGGYLVSVPPFDALLMALATFRITRLIVYDKIARWFRDLFLYEGGFFETVQDLLSCPWCIGIWSSLVVVFCYFLYDWAWFVIFFLALAAAGSFLQIIANAVGWKAEHTKQQVEER